MFEFGQLLCSRLFNSFKNKTKIMGVINIEFVLNKQFIMHARRNKKVCCDVKCLLGLLD